MTGSRFFSFLLALAVAIGCCPACSAQPADPPEAGIKVENDINDLLGLADPYIRDKTQEATLASNVQKNSNMIRDVLYWSGDRGYLVKVNIETETNTDVSRIAGEPELIGSGDSEAGALLRYWSAPSILSPGASSGFRLDPDRSFFLWITPVAQLGGKPTLAYGFVPPAIAGKIEDDVRAQLTDEDLTKAMRDADRDAVLLSVLDRMQSASQDAAEKARLKVVADSIREAELKLAGIQSKLDAALAEAKAGDNFLNMLKVLKLALSTVVLAGEVDATLNMPAMSSGLPTVDLNGASDQTILEQRVQSWRAQIGSYTQTYQGILTTWGPKLKSAEDKGLNAIPPNSVPDELYLRLR